MVISGHKEIISEGSNLKAFQWEIIHLLAINVAGISNNIDLTSAPEKIGSQNINPPAK